MAEDLKNIKEYIAEDNEEMAVKTIQEIYAFRIWELILLRESAFGRIINM